MSQCPVVTPVWEKEKAKTEELFVAMLHAISHREDSVQLIALPSRAGVTGYNTLHIYFQDHLISISTDSVSLIY